MPVQDILIVDDERSIRMSLADLLAGSGYPVRQAASGPAALEAFRMQRPDLVLLDVMMPEMDGYAVCHEMRRLDRETPIVFLSAMDSEENQIEGLRLGANDYVSKTASEALLLARIAAVLERADHYSKREAPASMTKTEADIYRLLDSQRGKTFSQREILDAVCGEGYRVVDAVIRVHISNMRRKLPPGESIRSARNLGYALVP